MRAFVCVYLCMCVQEGVWDVEGGGGGRMIEELEANEKREEAMVCRM